VIRHHNVIYLFPPTAPGKRSELAEIMFSLDCVSVCVCSEPVNRTVGALHQW